MAGIANRDLWDFWTWARYVKKLSNEDALATIHYAGLGELLAPELDAPLNNWIYEFERWRSKNVQSHSGSLRESSATHHD